MLVFALVTVFAYVEKRYHWVKPDIYKCAEKDMSSEFAN